jgi:hypothetical protein
VILREGRRGSELACWTDREIAACEFADVRLGKRFRSLLEQIAGAVGESIPMACQDWTNTKAAYRFSPMNGSTKPIFWRVTSRRRATGS